MLMARPPEHGQRRSDEIPGYRTALVPIFGDDVSAAAIAASPS